MPHQCTGCGRAFDDGSKEMLSGCPDCGGNKFQFKPESAIDDETGASGTGGADGGSGKTVSETADRGSSPGRTSESAATPSNVASGTPSRDGVADESEGQQAPRNVQTDTSNGGIVRSEDESLDEDDAQANARSNVVSRDELSEARASLGDETRASNTAEADTNSVGSSASDYDDAAEQPALDDLREELNDQFESIKIVSPGKYELNLMELYDRQECIISLQEDGRYVIEMPDTWDEREE